MSIFAKKTIASLVAEADDKSGENNLKRVLGPWNLMALGVGAIIGAGIFVLTGTAAAHHAGPALVISFILSGLVCAFAGLCYAEFASVIPVSGSAYTYSYATMGEVFAWLLGWDLLLEYALGASTVAVGWSGYFVSVLKDVGVIIPPQWALDPFSSKVLEDGTLVNGVMNLPALAIVLLTTFVLVRGISESSMINNIVVALKLIVILAFVAVGVWHINPSNWIPFVPENTGVFGEFGWSGVLTGASLIFFAYIGFDAVSAAAQEAKNPQKDVPFAMLGALFICTLLYIIVAATLTGVVHYSELGVPDPIAVAVNVMNLPWFSFLVKIGALFGLTSVILVLFYAQTRIAFVISRDGLIPPVFSRIHPRYKTPYVSTLVTGAAMAVMAGLVPIKVLHEMVNFGTLLAFMLVCFGVLWLRYSQPQLHRPFRCPWVPFVPAAGIISCLALMYGLPVETLKNLAIWFALGGAWYYWYGRKNSKLARGLV
jgi:APA family basic amino acid/polyamine antiporter